MSEEFSLEAYYDAYPRLEEDFQRALDVSLEPRGSELLYEMVSGLSLPPGAAVVDVGCGEGKQALELAERFGFSVRGFDPVPRHVELANDRLVMAAERVPGLQGRVLFEVGRAEALPVEDASVDLIWCRDVLVHVAEIDRAYGDFRRALTPGGHALIYQSSFATDRLEPGEAAWLWRTTGVVPASADPARTEAVIADAGLHIDEQTDVGIEWAEASEERTGGRGRSLLHLARLLRAPERYVQQFGQPAYEIMVADCLWQVYHMIGKLGARVYLLSRPRSG